MKSPFGEMERELARVAAWLAALQRARDVDAATDGSIDELGSLTNYFECASGGIEEFAALVGPVCEQLVGELARLVASFPAWLKTRIANDGQFRDPVVELAYLRAVLKRSSVTAAELRTAVVCMGVVGHYLSAPSILAAADHDAFNGISGALHQSAEILRRKMDDYKRRAGGRASGITRTRQRGDVVLKAANALLKLEAVPTCGRVTLSMLADRAGVSLTKLRNIGWTEIRRKAALLAARVAQTGRPGGAGRSADRGVSPKSLWLPEIRLS